MEPLKNSLGPFELFSAIIGGSPFVLAGFLIYHPVKSLAELVPVIQANGTIAIAIVLIFISYIIGGSIQGLSWQYFLRICRLLKRNYLFLDHELRERAQALNQPSPIDGARLDFEDRLVLLLQEKIDLPKQMDWINNRLKAYLREHNSPAVATADTYIASHIMYRNLSCGCLLLCGVHLINAIRLRAFEPLLIAPILGYTAYLMFHQSVSFKKWQNRTLLLGFYFAATKDPIAKDPIAKDHD